MLNRTKYILIGIAILSIFLVSTVNAARLDDPRTDRECYKEGLPFWVCVIRDTMIMEASFMEYEQMHDYYTPQLKEINLSGGETYTLSAKKGQIGTLSITGSPSYAYVKGGNN